jgi:spore germination cell wall hydrolase CwlJ-like protein
MSNTATGRAAKANAAAKAKVKDRKCPNCPKKKPKKKCDAQLPKDETTKKVALTIYGESSPFDTDEMTAIGSTIHNRVGHSGFDKPKDIDAVLNQRYPKNPAIFQYNAYRGSRYRKGEDSSNLNEEECQVLKNAIAVAEKLKNEGVPAEFKNIHSFKGKSSVIDKSKGFIKGNHFFYPK